LNGKKTEIKIKTTFDFGICFLFTAILVKKEKIFYSMVSAFAAQKSAFGRPHFFAALI